MMKDPDLEEHFVNSLIVLDQRSETDRNRHDQTIIAEKLAQELEYLRKSELRTTQQLQTLLCTSEAQDNITALYVTLKEKYTELQNKYNELEQEKLQAEDEFASNKNEINQNYLNQIKSLQNKLKEQQEEFIKNESDYQNELQVQQASGAINYDEMESHLQFLLTDATQKLHMSNQSCNAIRAELLNVKTSSNTNMDSSNKKIQELERKLRLTEQQLQITQEKLFNTNRNQNCPVYSNCDNSEKERTHINVHSTKAPTNIIKNRIVMYKDNPQYPLNKTGTIKPNYVCTTTKYHSLNASSSDEFEEMSIENVNVQTVQSSSNLPNKKNKQNNNKFGLLPPLKQVSNLGANQRPNVSKRRKLFDPDNLDYLRNLELQE